MSKFLGLPDVIARTTLSRSNIYLRMERGDFPKPVKLGERKVAWLESDIDSWMADKVAAQRAAG
jgi:prophage regulatory protein